MVAAHKLDTTIYPETDHMGEGELQQLINESLRPELARFLGLAARVAHVGSNTFIYYRQFDSSSRIAPDIYVLPGVLQGSIARSWKLWELGGPPSFALEVVSLDVDKDYIVAPAIHAGIGTKELVVFDPERGNDPERHLWQVFRRVRGIFRVVERSNADRVRSREIGAFLRTVGSGGSLRVRIATGPRGETLFPTEAEAERADKEQARADKEQERAAKEQERAAKEQERAEKEQERAQRFALEAQMAALKRELAALRGAKAKRAKR